jgi:DNA repair exonuclease SbcCD ATPase subunit
MIDQDQVLQVISKEGPVLPIKISKAIGTNLLFASAVLSELVSKNKLKVSNVKIGSSPLYYKPGQESRLQGFSKHLNDKDKKVYDILKESKVMRDSVQDPLTRVALRQIKDFAVPLEVTFNDQKEIFWKWYMLPNGEAEQIIKKLLNVPSPEETEKKKREEEARLAEENKRKEEAERKKVEAEQKKAEAEKRKLAEQQRKVEEEKQKSSIERKQIEGQQRLEMEKFKLEEEQRVLSARKQIEEERRKLEEEKKKLKKEQLLQKQKLEEEMKKIRDHQFLSGKEAEKKKQEEKDPFFKTMSSFFSTSKVKVLESNIIKKKSEIEFLIEFESAVGDLAYYCIARNKKRVSESDLNAVFAKSQLKKLPVMMLITGDLTKKAKEMLGKEFKGLTVKKI